MDAAKMEALDGLVTEVDGDGPEAAAEDQRQAQAAVDLEAGAREWGMIAYVIGNGLSMVAPELKQVYTEDACMGWGRSMMPVAEKYGWNNPAAVPELGLVIASMSLGVPSVLAIRERVRQAKAEKAVREGQSRAAAAGGAAPGPAVDGC